MRKLPTPEQYPPLVKVGHAIYHIVFVDKLKDGDLGGCSDKADGRVIMISRDQSPEEMFATYFHELLHAFEFESGLKLGHSRIRKLEYLIVNSLFEY